MSSSNSSSISSFSTASSSFTLTKSIFERDISSKDEQKKLSSSFLGSLPLLNSSEYKDNIVLITGGNKGLGYETARQLGSKGLKVLVGCRDVERGKAAIVKLQQEEKNGSFEFIHLDVNSSESIETAVKTVNDLYGHLDILINNAGILAGYGQPSEIIGEELRKTYETNVFGPMILTKAFLPLLEKSFLGRIVNVSSGLGSVDAHLIGGTYAAFNAASYCTSKAALNMYTVLLANELANKNSKIRTNTIDPGYTATDLNHHSGPQTLEEGTEAIIAASLLSIKGPTGTYFNRFGNIAW